MTDAFFKLLELSQAGFDCSQILLIIGLEAQGKENPDVIRAMSGLVGGMGFSGKNCGILTGGACLLGLYAGKGTAEEMEDSRLNDMIKELVAWFEQDMVPKYGGIDCDMILEHNPANRPARCPTIMLQMLEKIGTILTANGYEAGGFLNPEQYKA